jgi:hypothetical protein
MDDPPPREHCVRAPKPHQNLLVRLFAFWLENLWTTCLETVVFIWRKVAISTALMPPFCRRGKLLVFSTGFHPVLSRAPTAKPRTPEAPTNYKQTPYGFKYSVSPQSTEPYTMKTKLIHRSSNKRLRA